MNVKEAGPLMSNAEVLRWLKQTRARHAAENEQLAPNLVNSLERHERHLSSAAYPYQKNPSVYGGKKAEENIHRLAAEHLRRIQYPLIVKYNTAIRDKTLTKASAQKKLKAEQERKELSEAEMLMIYNLAPSCVELLQPIIEEIDSRFTADELEIMVEIINEILRADETGPQKPMNDHHMLESGT